jgi:hypothetical protein
MAKSLQQLLTEYDKTNKEISFTEFVDKETRGQEKTSGARALVVDSNYLNPLVENASLEKEKTYTTFRGDELIKNAPETTLTQTVKQSIPQEPRRIVADITDMLVGGTASLAYDVGSFFNISDIKLPDKFKTKVKDSYQIAMGETFGYDILEAQQDEDGEYKYDLQKPETITGNLTSTLTAFYGSFKKGQNPIKALTTPKPKKGRPPKEDSPAYFKQLKKQRRIGTAQNLAAAEFAGQIVLDPEEGRLAYDLGKWAGQNDIILLDTIFEYLDLEDPAEQSAMENRLGLLTESLTTGGIIVGGFNLFIKTLQGIRAGGSVAINQFKKTANAGRENTNAFQVKEELKPNKVFEPTKLPSLIENSVFGQATQSTVDFVRKVVAQGFTSKGIKSEKMFSIINQADNAKIATAQSTLDTVARIEYGLRRAAKEIASNPLSRKNRNAYDELNNKFRAYLTGSVKLTELPKYLQPIAQKIRTDVDKLSKKMTTGRGADYISEELQNTIKNNVGTYLRKTYEIFENPQWSPSRAVKLDAINYIAKSLRRTNGYREVKDGATDADRYAEATKRVNKLLKDSKGQTSTNINNSVRTHLNQMFGTKQAEKLFANRKNIAPEIRALLGETTAGTTSVYRTLTTMSNYLTDIKMYDEILAAGQGKYFFDDNIKRANTVKIQGKQFHALEGKYTTPEIAEMFQKQSESKNKYLQAWDKLLVLKGFGQASATVLNNITHIRNTIGQSIIMAENGLNPFGAETSASFKVLVNNFKDIKNQDEAVKELYLKYQRLGLVNQNVKVGEFKRTINEAALGQDQLTGMISNSLTKRGVGAITGGVKKVYKKTEQLYVAEDDLFRIAAYEKELLTLKEANTLVKTKLTTEQLERKAAEIIRDTMPTYDLIPDAAKALRRLPVGNFFAFSAERFRNTFHTYKRGIEEISSGNDVLAKRGFERLAAKTAIGLGGSTAVVESSKLLYGITEEQDKAYKDLLVPTWSKDGSIGYYRNDKGELLFYDLAYTDPDAPVLELIRSSYNELIRTDKPLRDATDILYDATKEGMKTFFKPYVSEALLVQATMDAVFNKGETESGSRIPGWNAAEPNVMDNLSAAFNYTVNTLIPAAYKNIFPDIELGPVKLGKKGNLSELIYREVTDRPQVRRFDGSEKDLNLDLLANTTGFRLYKIDDKSLEVALSFKTRNFSNKRELYKKGLLNDIQYGDTYEDVLDQFIRTNTDYYAASAEFNKAILAAQVLDVDIMYFTKSLQGTNQELNALKGGDLYFDPLKLKAYQLTDIMDKVSSTTNIPDFESFQIQLYKIQEQFSALPLLELPEAAQKLNTKTDFPEREQKFTGGLIDPKFPVSDVAENPASRDIANQLDSFEDIANDKNPYKKDMERLGFNEGKKAAIDNWYATQQKNKRLNSERNAAQYVQAQINRLANRFGIEYSEEALENFNKFKRILSTAESDNRQTTQNKYEQYEGASQDALKNLLDNADKNQIDKEWLQSIDPTQPETWDDGQADTMMLGYILSQKGTDEHVSQILQGNFGTNEKGPVRNLYENNWVRAKFGGEYESINPNSDPEANFKRAMDLNL